MGWNKTLISGGLIPLLMLYTKHVLAFYTPYQAAEAHAMALHNAETTADETPYAPRFQHVPADPPKAKESQVALVSQAPEDTPQLPQATSQESQATDSQAPPGKHTERSPLALANNYYYFTMCDYAGEKFPPGAFSPEPCTNCHCNATTGKVTCSTPDCPSRANCIDFARTPGECCPECVKKGCYYKGKAYPPGAKIDSGPCDKCYCPWEGGDESTGEPTCLSIQCPKVRCVDADIPTDKCCPVCPNGPNCWLDKKVIPEGERIYIDKCRFCYCSNMEYIYNATQRHASCVRSFFCL